MHKRGFIKLVPVEHIDFDMLVYWDECPSRVKIWFVNEIHDNFVYLLPSLNSPRAQIVNKSKLKTIVIECEICDPLTLTFKQHLLKYSQWQSVLDNGEINSDKVVEFELENSNRLNYAKIIPQKKRVYTRDEVKQLIKDSWIIAFDQGMEERTPYSKCKTQLKYPNVEVWIKENL